MPGSVLSANTSVHAVVSGTDAAGNPFASPTDHSYSVDLGATATITVDAITNDNVINDAESSTTIPVTGNVGGDAKPGDTVTLTIGGTPYTGTVAVGNTYSIDVPGSALAANTSVHAVVSGTDAAGNPFSAPLDHAYGVDLSATATITVDSVTLDNVINGAESSTTIPVTGTVGGDAKPGDTVTLTIGGTPYTGTVAVGNTYSIDVPGSVLSANTSVHAVVSGTDAAGNPFTSPVDHAYGVDLSATATITVDAITNDNVINGAESSTTIPVTGTVGGDAKPGDTVTLTIGGTPYTGTVAAGNTYSIDVPGSALAANTSVHAVVSGTDAAGNPFSAPLDHAYGVDLSATATITVDAITNDNVINGAESSTTIPVTGTVGGDAKPGDTVTLTIGGTPYTGTVAAGNTYSIDVPGSALAANTSVHAVVSGTDAAGNPFSAPLDHAYGVDLSATATITVDSVTLDNVINGAESSTTIPVTGTVGGDAQPGDTVTLTIGGTPYTGTVAAGNTYSIDVPGSVLAANTSVHAVVSGTDAAGNPCSTPLDHAYGVDLSATATITVDSITNDNVINSTEATETIAVTGTVGGDAKPGDTVTLTIGGTPYIGTVAAGNTYSIDVPGSVLAANSMVHAAITATDTAGNTQTATQDHGYTSVLAANATIHVDPITADNTINATESGQSISITGTVGGVAQPGDPVTLTIGGTPYSGVVASDNSFSINVPGATLASNTVVIASVAGHDGFGNPATGSDVHSYSVDTTASIVITNDGTNGDGIYNKTESAHVTLSGTTSGVENGQSVTVTFKDSLGHTVTDTATVSGNAWTLAGTPASLSTLSDGPLAVSASVSDVAGNNATATAAPGLDTAAAATITVDAITNDNVINATETTSAVMVTGTVGGDAKAGDTVTLTVGSTPYTGIVIAGGTYSISVPGSVLAANNSVHAVVSGTDTAGNPFSMPVDHSYNVDMIPPSTSIGLANTAASDTGTSSSDDITANFKPVVTGTGEPNSTVTVTIDPDNNPATHNSITYTANTDASGNWSLDLTSATPVSGSLPVAGLPAGVVGLNIVSTDAAGNSSTAGNTFTITNPHALADTAVAIEAGGISNSTPGTNPSGNVLTNDTNVTGIDNVVSAVTGSAAGTVGGSTAGAHGALALNSDGSYSYTLDNNDAAVQALRNSGDTLTDTFTYTIRDAAGATSTATLTVTVIGADDTAVIGGTDTGNVKEDTTLLTGGTLTIVDPDAGEAAFVAQSGVAGAHGSFNLDTSGNWTYTLNNGDATVQGLKEGQTLPVESFVVHSIDGTAHTVSVTITGTNDAPVAMADTASVTEDVPVTTTAVTGVLSNDTDIDTGDTKTVSAVAFGATTGTVGSALAGTYGTLTLNADGSYSYLANKATAEALGAGQTATDTFTYTMHDAAGATSSTTLTFNITGTNDAPVAVADTASATEDVVVTATALTGVLANDIDIDTGDTKTVSAVAFGAHHRHARRRTLGYLRHPDLECRWQLLVPGQQGDRRSTRRRSELPPIPSPTPCMMRPVPPRRPRSLSISPVPMMRRSPWPIRPRPPKMSWSRRPP